MPASTPLPKCPKCNSIIPPGRTACVSCGLEVSMMDEFRSNRPAPKRREVPQESFWSAHRRDIITYFIIPVSLILLYIVYRIGTRPPEPWTTLPTDPEKSVAQYIKLIGNDGDANNVSHKAAYAMIASSSKNRTSATEPDRFLQYHHDVYVYFSELTADKNWHDHAKISPDPKRADAYEIKIGPEIVHIAVVDEAPQAARDAGKHHFAVTPILEIDPNSEARKSSGGKEVAYSAIRGVGGGIDDLKAIAAMSAPPRESAMDKKMRLFPRLASPRAPELDFDIIRLWPIRTDPAVISRLNQLIDDARYTDTSRERARQVINGSLDEETRTAAGVN